MWTNNCPSLLFPSRSLRSLPLPPLSLPVSIPFLVISSLNPARGSRGSLYASQSHPKQSSGRQRISVYFELHSFVYLFYTVQMIVMLVGRWNWRKISLLYCWVHATSYRNDFLSATLLVQVGYSSRSSEGACVCEGVKRNDVCPR